MAKYTYEQIRTIVAGNGGLQPTPSAVDPNAPLVGQTVEFTGTVTIDIGQYQDKVLALKFDEETDQTFDQTITGADKLIDVQDLTGIDSSKTNIYSPSKGGSLFLNSDRITINAKQDFAMMFGEKGVALGSPNKVNIDAGDSITLFGHQSVFLGIPNRGEVFDKKDTVDKKTPSSVGDSTPDEYYEPLVLGIKLINFIEDLIVTIENAEIAGPLGNGVFQPSTLAEFELLKVRLPELISTYAYVDGLSHNTIDEERLAVVKKARDAAEDYVPPRQLVGTVTGTATITAAGEAGPQPNPVTSPYAALPGYYETPSTDPYGDSGTL